MIPIKKGAEIDGMRRSSQVLGRILAELSALVQPGLTTRDLDEAAARMIREAGGKSPFYGYRGFPGHICVSVSEEVVHGIPGKRKLLYGEIVKLDIGIVLNGWVSDTAASIPVGAVAPEIEALLAQTQLALVQGIGQARAGNRLGDISAAIERCVVGAGYTVVREFVGHGVGRSLHEEPQIPNYGRSGSGPLLKAGMTLAIEPMVNLGQAEIRILQDGWTVVTVDGKPSSHFEHTVLVTDGEPEILTGGKSSTLS
ncbi:MAG: type I methionyl aminopeptidase [Verrucomicrobiales bacterium]|jgi:methionyl aminopeptidase|nr:type I methionyl aminopeptidase [Verrucomicrobiales bacterium]